MAEFNVIFQQIENSFDADFQSEENSFSATVDTVVKVLPDPFTGSYEYTPSSEDQTIQAKGMVLMDDILINKIPSNYGLITWNGSTLTVS